MSTFDLTEKAAQQIQGRLSFGLIGGAVGIEASASNSSGEGKKDAEKTTDEKISYTFSSQAMGPATTEPATFTKLLHNNSTWALIDRGSCKAYIPVWELIKDLGSEFQEAATAVQNAWEEREERWRKESERLGKQLTKIVRKDVESLTEKYLKKDPDEIGYGFLPDNSAQLINSSFANKKTIDLSREKAYALALEKIMVDPRYRICVVSISPNGKFMVRCWEASEDSKMTFASSKGKHELIYSRIAFKWKDRVPQK
ncbi:uncharacterized protein LOC114516551 [Dendronephthya gigantea]|uniref:uncharacterized protein LOC114516551 n=1 Tax=Dendronephthya gigantea TaxID=151771 RepID=UPI00106A128E|nr:uncharacterized protein LOC114516551 [Dendronephthya gigantea]